MYKFVLTFNRTYGSIMHCLRDEHLFSNYELCDFE